MATTRSSDIWSLGCLFYELLTGKFLFEEIETDYFGFMYKANTLSISELLTNEKLKELNHNQYLIDFLKFMLVKDQNHRPNIETIMNRFEHVHALLVNIGGTVNASQNLLTKRSFGGNIENSLEICESLISYNKNSPNYLLKSDYNHKLKWIPQMMKLTAEIFLADISWGENNFEKLQKLHITHIVSCTKPRNRNYEKFLFLNILEDTNDIGTSTFSCLFKVMDFLRHCMIYRGSVLFLDDFQYMNIPGKPNVLIRGIILLCFSFMLNLSVYDTWTYLNSKILFLSIPPDILSELSNWVFHQNIVNSFTYSHPYMRCLCGACGVVFKKSYLDVTNLHTKKCLCSQKQNTNFYSECPSSGCLEYMQDMKVM
jgi:serine/threonine protein kinase